MGFSESARVSQAETLILSCHDNPGAFCFVTISDFIALCNSSPVVHCNIVNSVNKKPLNQMDRIKQLLQEQGKQVSDTVVQAKLIEYGLNPSNVSEADAKTIAQELEPVAQAINGLAVSNGSNKPVNNKGKGRGKGRTKKLQNEVDQASFDASIIHLADITKQEIDTVTTTLSEGANAWKEQTKDEWKAIIRNTPVEAMNELLDEVKEEAADIASFRTTSLSAIKGIFPLRNSSATI